MTDNKNVFILFEEIKTMLEGMKSKLEELTTVIDGELPDRNAKQDLSPIKDVFAETTRTQSEEIKGLLAKQWKAYAQLSTLTLQQLDAIKRSQDEQGEQKNCNRKSISAGTVSTSNQARYSLSLWD